MASNKKTHISSPNTPQSNDLERNRAGDDVGSALRAAYKSTVDEAIPPEMLELLSKLK